MATVDPRYWTDATTAADKIVGGYAGDVREASPDVVRAVLAQWICESGWTYPPRWNNPGSTSKGWAEATKTPYTIPLPNPQPSDPIVAYATLALGVAAYAKGFLVIRDATGLKYKAALAAAAVGNGVGFVSAALAQHYGTSMGCFGDVNAMLTAVQPMKEDWGDTMISTGGHIEAVAYRYPVTSGMPLYAGTDLTKLLKNYSGTPGNARCLGPAGGSKWDDATWEWAAIVIATSAFDVKGTVVYISKPDKRKLVAASSVNLSGSATRLRKATADRDTL